MHADSDVSVQSLNEVTASAQWKQENICKGVLLPSTSLQRATIPNLHVKAALCLARCQKYSRRKFVYSL